MRMTVFGRSFELTEAIVRHVEGRVRLSLGAAAERIESVSVRLSDVNGPRGGEDKRCRVVVYLRQGRDVVTEAVDGDLYAAVDAAVGRAKEAVWRFVHRRRTLRRQYAYRSRLAHLLA
jgi:putative sigma-54 modulation protein